MDLLKGIPVDDGLDPVKMVNFLMNIQCVYEFGLKEDETSICDLMGRISLAMGDVVGMMMMRMMSAR